MDQPSAKTSASFRTASGLNPYTGVFSKDALIHLLKRSGFGAKPSDIQALSGLSLSQVIAKILTQPSSAPTPPINVYNDANYTDPDVPYGQTWINAPYTDGTANYWREVSFKAWWTGLMVQEEQSCLEKMVLFWHNHFSTQLVEIGYARYAYINNALIRNRAFGNFKTLVKEITLDPAMLNYLNGQYNTKTAPDENYARELQELFTLGKGPNSQYTEDDVKAAARVLTGYRINGQAQSFFDSSRHDTANKQFSSFFGNTIIGGKTGAAGATELDELLNMIFANDEVALYICRRIYRYFVYYEIDAATENNVIAPLAAIFRQNNYEIKPVLAALFASEHFFDPLNRGCVIKSPVELTVGLCREFEVDFPNINTNAKNAYYMWGYVQSTASNLQQNIGDPPNVAGWPAYYQEPQFYEIWINADTLPKRNQFTDRLVGSGYTRNGSTILIDPIAFVDGLSNPADPNVLINDSLAMLYSIPVSQALKDFLKTILLSGQSTDIYWTSAWTDYKNNPSNASFYKIVLTRLLAFYKYLMNLAEYQLT
jgi:uncharacterized protein (DUF1800 family)